MYFTLVDRIKNHLDNDPITNTVSKGDIFKIDLSKSSIFPICHILVNNVTLEGSVVRYSISIIAMDLVDFSKEEGDAYEGNNNEAYVLNTQLEVMKRLSEMLRRGELMADGFHLDGNPTCEPFTDRFENVVAGWTMNLDVLTFNDMTIC